MSKLKDEFTARELSRRTREVLAATEVFGSVTIRSRNGKAYEIRLTSDNGGKKPSRKKLEARFSDYEEKLKALDFEPPSDADFENLDAIIAGDE